jgi:hypothetical protein
VAILLTLRTVRFERALREHTSRST